MPYYQYPPEIHVHINTLANSRGMAYVRAFKALFASEETSAALSADIQSIAKATGKFTVINLFDLAAKYQVNFKLMCEWLAEVKRPDTDKRYLPCGFYEHEIQGNKNIRIRDELAAAHQRIKDEEEQ